MTFLGMVAAGINRLKWRYAPMSLVLFMCALTLTIGVNLGSYAGGEAAQGVDDSPALRTISLYNQGEALTEAALATVSEMKGVEAVDPYVSVVVGLDESRSVLTLIGLSKTDAPPLIAGKGVIAEETNGVVLPASADGVSLQKMLGKETAVTYTTALSADSGVTKRMVLTVVGISDPSYQVDAPLAGYAPATLVTQLAAERMGASVESIKKSIGYERATVVAASQAEVETLTKELQTAGFHATNQLQVLKSVPGIIQLIRMVTFILFVALSILSLLSATSIAHSVSSQRVTDVAVLKTYGWPTRRIMLLFVAELGSVIVGAILVGVATGVVVSVSLGTWARGAITGDHIGAIEVPAIELFGGAVLSGAVILSIASLVLLKACRVSVLQTFRRL